MLYLLNDPRSTIHRILHPNPRPIDADPEKLNNHFATIAERLTGREGKSHDDLIQIINDMPCVVGEEFLLRNVTYLLGTTRAIEGKKRLLNWVRDNILYRR